MNPWDVETLSSFSFLCCPECDYKSKQEGPFEEHALENHPLSICFFAKMKIEGDDPLLPDDTFECHDLHNETNEGKKWVINGSSNAVVVKLVAQNTSNIFGLVPKQEVLDEDNVMTDELDYEHNLVHCRYKHCKKVFNDEDEMEEHYKIKHETKKNPWECTKCQKQFKLKKQLLKHARIHKRTEQNQACKDSMIKCPKCPDIFTTTFDVEKHIQDVHLGWQCLTCEKSFTTLKNLDNHNRISHSYFPLQKCPECHVVFNKLNDLLDHMKSHTWACNECTPGKLFSTEKQLRNHTLFVHLNEPAELAYLSYRTKEDTIDFKCGKCFKILNDHMSCQDHFRLDHEEIHQCSKCDRQFLYARQLKEHLLSHTTYTCDKCGRTIVGTKCNITAHDKICAHVGKKSERKFKCEKCTFTTHQPKGLTYHMEAYHSENPKLDLDGLEVDENGFITCLACSKKIEMYKYVSHFKAAHGCYPPGYKLDIVQCDQCPKQFRKTTLPRHMRRCHPEVIGEPVQDLSSQRVQCNICGKTFCSPGALNRHLENVHGDKSDKKFHCDKCDYKTHSLKYLKAHVFNIHQGKKAIRWNPE